MKYFNFFIMIFTSSICWGHARLTSPTPRNNNAGIKAGPCGGLAKSAVPTIVQGGQMLTVQWEETINHPGRFIFSLSPANDIGFESQVLATIVDNQNAGVALPHRYQAQIMMPNMNCPNCTLQMIQSMEENPAAPSYYYSCADINITTSSVPPTNPPPTGNVESIQNSTIPSQQFDRVKFGQGCGTVKSVNSADINLISLFVFFLTLLMPILTWLRLRSV